MQAREDGATDARKQQRDNNIDRQINWGLRFASQMQYDVLVLVVDILDKSYLRLATRGVGALVQVKRGCHRPRICLHRLYIKGSSSV